MEEKDGDCRSTGDDGGWGTRKVRHPLGASITPLVIYGPGLIHTLVVFRGYSTLALHHVDRPATKTTFDLDRFSFSLFFGGRDSFFRACSPLRFLIGSFLAHSFVFSSPFSHF